MKTNIKITNQLANILAQKVYVELRDSKKKYVEKQIEESKSFYRNSIENSILEKDFKKNIEAANKILKKVKKQNSILFTATKGEINSSLKYYQDSKWNMEHLLENKINLPSREEIKHDILLSQLGENLNVDSIVSNLIKKYKKSMF